MTFWLLSMALGLALAALLVREALRAPREAPSHPDMAIYRAQLDELDRDEARGLLTPDAAAPVRAEIARRILEADRKSGARSEVRAEGSALPLILATIVALGCGGALYMYLGSPGYADLPRSQRLAASERIKASRPTQAYSEAAAEKARPKPAEPPADFAKLMDQLRAAVAKRPDDVTGLRLLAENERKLGNLSAAARAQEQLVRTLGDKATAEDRARLADILINAAGGSVSAEAEQAIISTLNVDPTNPTARFYAGLTEAQTGRPDLAFNLWNGLLQNGPPDAPWVPFIRARMPMLADAVGTDWRDPTAKSPDAAAVAAAGQMSATDRMAMIRSMVEGLESRLMGGTGGTPTEWAQLVTALGVLGEKDRQTAALAKAETALASDPAGLAQVRAAASAPAGTAP